MAELATDTRRRPLRVGHKGAAAVVPGNTLASFDAALALGVDMIELDVLSTRPDGGGELLIAHDYEALRSHPPLSLAEALEHLASPPFAGIQIDLDVKLPGYELRVVEQLRTAGLTDRTLLSGMYPSALARVRAAEPSLRLGWSVPRVRRDYTSDLLTAIPALAALTGYRAALPRRARATLASGAVDAIMAHWRVVTPALLRAVRSHGGELYVWTVDDAARIASLTALGVDGIITNDPRLFAGDRDGSAEGFS
ncbi:MAG TPA: glycerophosphodiester phosphodiesterase [Solirubrobacteraceae bacterium]|jgi:glycerophosphoryl diester phosphodiesterase|nr:glycerophosphodiester phosphodiesterase [Solirubrobacteraceae bacterium]